MKFKHNGPPVEDDGPSVLDAEYELAQDIEVAQNHIMYARGDIDLALRDIRSAIQNARGDNLKKLRSLQSAAESVLNALKELESKINLLREGE